MTQIIRFEFDLILFLMRFELDLIFLNTNEDFEKCFENNELIQEILEQDGTGKILLIDGGGSSRRALIDIELAELAVEKHWQGIVVYGAVRHVDELEECELGIQAIASIPVAADSQGSGEQGVPVNFAGVSFYEDDYLYADSTGIIISAEELVLEDALEEVEA